MNDLGSLAVGFVVAESGSFSGNLTGLLPGPNLWDFSHKLLVGSLSLTIADFSFNGLGDGNPFGRGEILPDFVLGVFALDDAPHINDASQDRFLLEDVSGCLEPALSSIFSVTPMG